VQPALLVRAGHVVSLPSASNLTGMLAGPPLHREEASAMGSALRARPQSAALGGAGARGPLRASHDVPLVRPASAVRYSLL
jgi:hypothetical protein